MRSSLISFMEPCEDFYEFTCGGWMKAARVPHEEVVHSTLSEVHRRVENEISDILNNTVISYRDQTATQKASALYQGCINIGEVFQSQCATLLELVLDLRNSKGTKPVEDLLQFFELANWPMLNRTAQFRTFFILGNIIRELGLDAIISVRVGLDYHNSDRYLIYIPWSYFINVIVRDVGVSMDLTDHVVVLNPLYLKRLSRLLKEVPR
ncbi:hypothetical protein V5799_033759 [Amblyomma americanum]|uniref:Peptidase M13 N-terminal domain-containing protein n=1 Tax=Amblyomma americanum TaxID=6943 RepID=A0AAQ4DME3_AMBAM